MAQPFFGINLSILYTGIIFLGKGVFLWNVMKIIYFIPIFLLIFVNYSFIMKSNYDWGAKARGRIVRGSVR